MEVIRWQKCGALLAEIRAALVSELLKVIILSIIDLLLLRLVIPDYPLAEFPNAVLGLVLRRVLENSEAVLLASVPPSLVHAPIRPLVDRIPSLHIILELARVAHTIVVNVDTVPAHLVLEPVAEVFATVLPVVLAHAVDPIVDPLAGVHRAVGPRVLTDAVLFALLVLSDVGGAFGPHLGPVFRLQIILPIAFVLCSILALVAAEAIVFVGPPFAVVALPVTVVEYPLATGKPILPLAIIHRSIRPSHLTLPVPETTPHLTFIDRTGTLIYNSRLCQR